MTSTVNDILWERAFSRQKGYEGHEVIVNATPLSSRIATTIGRQLAIQGCKPRAMIVKDLERAKKVNLESGEEPIDIEMPVDLFIAKFGEPKQKSTIPSTLRSVRENDLAILNGLEFAKLFPPQVTDGNWRMIENEPPVMRLVLSLPYSTTTSYTDDIRKMTENLNIVASDPKDSHRKAAKFTMKKNDRAGSHSLYSVHIEVQEIDPDLFAQRREDMIRVIEATGLAINALDEENRQAKDAIILENIPDKKDLERLRQRLSRDRITQLDPDATPPPQDRIR